MTNIMKFTDYQKLINGIFDFRYNAIPHNDHNGLSYFDFTNGIEYDHGTKEAIAIEQKIAEHYGADSITITCKSAKEYYDLKELEENSSVTIEF